MTPLLLVRLALVLLGIGYVVRIVRERRYRMPRPSTLERLGSPEHANARDARLERLERLRAQAAVGALLLFLPMMVSALVPGPVWLTTALLVGVGVSLVAYLVLSVASGWIEGG